MDIYIFIFFQDSFNSTDEFVDVFLFGVYFFLCMSLQIQQMLSLSLSVCLFSSFSMQFTRKLDEMNGKKK